MHHVVVFRCHAFRVMPFVACLGTPLRAMVTQRFVPSNYRIWYVLFEKVINSIYKAIAALASKFVD